MRRSAGASRWTPSLVCSCRSSHHVAPASTSGPTQVPGLAAVSQAGAAEDDLEPVIGLARAKLVHVANQIAHRRLMGRVRAWRSERGEPRRPTGRIDGSAGGAARSHRSTQVDGVVVPKRAAG